MPRMIVHKAHGTGNDFVVVPDPHGELTLGAAAVVALCDRRTGIGGDGLLRLAPASEGVPFGGRDGDHVFMDYRNADGTVAQMCGNGVRVVARHLHDHGWTDDRVLHIGTRAGTRTATVHLGPDGRVTSVAVDMGPPAFAGPDLPAVDEWGWADVRTATGTTRLLPVSMGNPHALVLVDDPAGAPVTTLGPELERADAFPQGVNVEFVAVRDRTVLDLRVWERGVGETAACGTGVCGAVAGLGARGLVDVGTDVTVEVPGGTLVVRWGGGADDPVLLTGPAEEVGTIELATAWQERVGLGSARDRVGALRNDRGGAA
jgi:diaminopimelate epimerase